MEDIWICVFGSATIQIKKDVEKVLAILISPVREIIKFIWDYIKSTSLTAVQMMLMRRILCILATHYRNGQSKTSIIQKIL